MKTKNLTLEITEAPEGIFTAQIKEVRGCVVQSDSEAEVLEEIFKQAWICVKVDSKNLIVL
jgi:predicted RNase H-like HicB family nuclease